MSKIVKQLTAEHLREVLSYDPSTGVFTWRKARPKVRAGMVAGGDCRGYTVIRIDLVLYQAHRLAWLYVHGRWPKELIDHINGNPSDNRLCNLPEATQSQNMGNARLRKKSKSGFKGVRSSCSKWIAYLGGHKYKHLGTFDTPEEAHAAYLAAAQERHGEFARSS